MLSLGACFNILWTLQYKCGFPWIYTWFVMRLDEPRQLSQHCEWQRFLVTWWILSVWSDLILSFWLNIRWRAGLCVIAQLVVNIVRRSWLWKTWQMCMQDYESVCDLSLWQQGIAVLVYIAALCKRVKTFRPCIAHQEPTWLYGNAASEPLV